MALAWISRHDGRDEVWSLGIVFSTVAGELTTLVEELALQDDEDAPMWATSRSRKAKASAPVEETDENTHSQVLI